MKLNEPKLIEQSLKTTVKEVEVLYWLLEDSVHNAQSGRSRAMLIILLYLGKYRPDLIRDGLREPQRKRLKTLTHEILNDQAIQTKKAVSLKQPVNPRKIPFKLEIELKDYLIKHPDILNEAFDDKIKIRGVEVEVGEDYRCDIVAESETFCYPIELKIAQGNHAVVSQCSKYCYYFYRKLRYGMFKNVQGVVIANGYDAWSINELRREGHWIYEIIPVDKDGIRLSKID